MRTLHIMWTTRPDIRSVRWTIGGEGGVRIPGGMRRVRAGGVGGTGTGKRLACGDPWRIQGGQGGKSGGGGETGS